MSRWLSTPSLDVEKRREQMRGVESQIHDAFTLFEAYPISRIQPGGSCQVAKHGIRCPREITILHPLKSAVTLASTLGKKAMSNGIRIGLLSDTHIMSEELPHQLEQVFRGVDLILHAGDIIYPRVLDKLEGIAPVLAARGDEDSDRLSDQRVREDHFLTFDGLSLWLRHRLPWGVLRDIAYGQEAEAIERIMQECPGTPDIVVFGDTHRANVQRLQGVLFINPGSPTLPGYESKLGTVALLTIASGEAAAHLVQLE